MQTLRNRLTVAETKLLEREVEIRNYQEETKTLKDAMENLAEKSSISSQPISTQHLVANGSKFTASTINKYAFLKIKIKLTEISRTKLNLQSKYRCFKI